jgi:hypothetical protein
MSRREFLFLVGSVPRILHRIDFALLLHHFFFQDEEP